MTIGNRTDCRSAVSSRATPGWTASGYREMTVTPSYPMPQESVPTLGSLEQPSLKAVNGLTLVTSSPGSESLHVPGKQRDIWQDFRIKPTLTRRSLHVAAGSGHRAVGPYYYGPYASFAPPMDSFGATCSAAESDLLAMTYGDLKGAAYIESIKAFTADMDACVQEHVDRCVLCSAHWTWKAAAPHFRQAGPICCGLAQAAQHSQQRWARAL